MIATDEEAAERISAVCLYAAFGPLACSVELATGAWDRHPALLVLATGFLALQTAASWFVCPMPLSGWVALAVCVPVTYVLYAIASPAGGQAIAVVLIVPVGWAATFLPARYVVMSVALNAAALSTLLAYGSGSERWLIFLTRVLTLAAVALCAHTVVGALRRAQRAAEERADTDPTTGLLSRSRMLDLLTQRLGTASEASQATHALLLVDIDHFKRINDTHGHLSGDDALRNVARVLTQTLRTEDLTARWGGEEFLVLAGDVPDERSLRALAEKLQLAISQTEFRLDAQPVRITVSVGAVLAEPGVPVRALVAAADDALYQAKRGGRNRVCAARSSISQVDVPGRPEDLAEIRRRVAAAASAAGLTQERVLDVVLAASEACAHLIRQSHPRALRVFTQDRDHQFAVSIANQTPINLAADADALGVAILTRAADHLRAEEHDGQGELTIVFAKDGPLRV